MTMAAIRAAGCRAAVLRAAAKGAVVEDWYDEDSDEPGDAWHRQYAGRDWKVTREVRWLKAGGWVETSPDDADLHNRRIVPTDAGRKWLADNPEEQP
jgi:hypothetical protein